MNRPQKLTEDEISYHATLVGQVKEAQEAQEKFIRTQNAWSNWADYLKQKYDLSDGDAITEVGSITYGEYSEAPE